MTRALVHGHQGEVNLHRPRVHQGSPQGPKRLEVILFEQAGTQARITPGLDFQLKTVFFSEKREHIFRTATLVQGRRHPTTTF